MLIHATNYSSLTKIASPTLFQHIQKYTESKILHLYKMKKYVYMEEATSLNIKDHNAKLQNLAIFISAVLVLF